jgi:hypothetical protein
MSMATTGPIHYASSSSVVPAGTQVEIIPGNEVGVLSIGDKQYRVTHLKLKALGQEKGIAQNLADFRDGDKAAYLKALCETIQLLAARDGSIFKPDAEGKIHIDITASSISGFSKSDATFDLRINNTLVALGEYSPEAQKTLSQLISNIGSVALTIITSCQSPQAMKQLSALPESEATEFKVQPPSPRRLEDVLGTEADDRGSVGSEEAPTVYPSAVATRPLGLQGVFQTFDTRQVSPPVDVGAQVTRGEYLGTINQYCRSTDHLNAACTTIATVFLNRALMTGIPSNFDDIPAWIDEHIREGHGKHQQPIDGYNAVSFDLLLRDGLYFEGIALAGSAGSEITGTLASAAHGANQQQFERSLQAILDRTSLQERVGIGLTSQGSSYALMIEKNSDQAIQRIWFFDSHGPESGGPAYMYRFSSLKDAAEFLAQKIPHPADQGHALIQEIGLATEEAILFQNVLEQNGGKYQMFPFVRCNDTAAGPAPL